MFGGTSGTVTNIELEEEISSIVLIVAYNMLLIL